MERIAVVLSGVPAERGVEVIAILGDVTGLNLGHIARCLELGEPLAEYRLFGNDHEEVAEELRQLLSVELPTGATLRLLELPDDPTAPIPTECPEIEQEVLLNMLDARDEDMRRQRQTWDEHGHA
ncbi:MAG: hypothetical protein L0241_07855 [Planctomycetia bacterium]|nr:hypothetical protein [Planctomycetia bacterium]